MNILDEVNKLNEHQKEAVTSPLGNLLVLAGAGSGKTRVLVHKVAWIVDQEGYSPYSILTVTFTNKAAGEMRSRLESMLGIKQAGMWVGTFHGLSHKMLRQHAAEAGLDANFQVIDSDDQLRIIKRIYKEFEIDDEAFDHKKVLWQINKLKDDGIRAINMPVPKGLFHQVLAKVYAEYERVCKENGLVDFAELLLCSFELLQKNQQILSHYQARFNHFLVDEFQDTNTIQYRWLQLLSKKAVSVTIVGDDDQSIYGWRGAKIENIYKFEKDYKNTRVIRLEQNYRSTNTILSAANELIKNNGSRMGKTLWTNGDRGEPITLYSALNEEDEAFYLIRKVKQWVENGGSINDVGVLYRSNAQSRVIEEALIKNNIEYSIYGGLRFFERAEIKDALAYLRLSVNDSDNTSFERVVNSPPRGIGDKSLEKIRCYSKEHNVSLYDAAQKCVEEKILTGKALNGLNLFLELIFNLQNMAKSGGRLTTIVEAAIKDSNLWQYFKEQSGEKAQSRAENLEELINATEDFVVEDEDLADESLVSIFLSYASLDSGGRARQADSAGGVQLMTMHSAKGLEFPLVFICGVEDGLFPHYLSKDDPDKLEEERRLCYVAITRAMTKLYITTAQVRRLFGRDEPRCPSRFIYELPSDFIEKEGRRVSVSSVSSNDYYDQSPRTFNNYPKVKSRFDKGSGAVVGDTSLTLGQRVHHKKFGGGTIVDGEGSGDRARVNVHFDSGVTKWLAVAFANLEPI